MALYLYSTRRIGQATLWIVLGAQLLLPAGTAIKLSMVPQFDKNTIPSLIVFVGCFLVLRRPLRFFQRLGLLEILLLAYAICPFVSAELNSDPIVLASGVLPAQSHYDAISATLYQFTILLPFLVGRLLLSSSKDNADIFRVLVFAGLLYSLPMFFELRMSPQLHYWVYGYNPHQFAQQARDGGWRPLVFTAHPLIAAFFIMTTAVAAGALWRTNTRIWRLPPTAVTAYLSATLILCKSLAAVLYGAALVPLVRFATPRLQMRIALALVSIALIFPTLRVAHIFPTAALVEAAASISKERADSLAYRFYHEELLLEHASQRLMFGWGRFGRSRIYDEETGQDIAVTDGHWIITLGQFGFFGFLAEFGLLTLPVIRAALALKFAKSMHEKVLFAALALIIAIAVIDQLPNSTVSSWTWLLAGALLGRAESIRSVAIQDASSRRVASQSARSLR